MYGAVTGCPIPLWFKYALYSSSVVVTVDFSTVAASPDGGVDKQGMWET